MDQEQVDKEQATRTGATSFMLQRLVLVLLLVQMLFILSPVEPAWFLPVSYPIYWTLLVLLGALWLFHHPRDRSIGGFEVALVALGAWMGIASLRSEPRLLHEFLAWESGILLALYAASSYGRVFGHRLLVCFLTGTAGLQLTVCAVQLSIYTNGEPTIAPNLFKSLFGDQAIYTPGQPPVDARFRFMTGAPGLGRRLTVAPGTFWTVNILGVWLAMALPVLASGGGKHRIHGRTLRQALFLALTVGCLLLIARNLTRGAFPGAIVGLLLYAGFGRVFKPSVSEAESSTLGESTKKRPSRFMTRMILPATLVLLGTIGLASSDTLRGAVQGRVVSGFSDDAGLRARLTWAGILAIGERPLLGLGHGNYRLAMPQTTELTGGLSERKQRIFARKPQERHSSHNAFLMAAHDAGLPALALLFIAIWLPLRDFWQLRGRWKIEHMALAASLGAALLMCFFYASLYREVWPFFLFILGCLRGATRADAETTAG